MPLWTKNDNTAGKPKYLNTTDKSNTVGVDDSEARTTRKGTTPGWNLKKTGTGGRAGRVSYEPLVAMSNFDPNAVDDSNP